MLKTQDPAQTKPATQQARVMFLNKIRERLAQEGRPLSGLALEYWTALEPEDEVAADALWKDKKLRAQLESLDKQFEAALRSAIEQDLINDGAAKDFYVKALHEVASLEGGVCLQALVFAAALSVPAIASADRGYPLLAGFSIGFALFVGVLIGLFMRYHDRGYPLLAGIAIGFVLLVVLLIGLLMRYHHKKKQLSAADRPRRRVVQNHQTQQGGGKAAGLEDSPCPTRTGQAQVRRPMIPQ